MCLCFGGWVLKTFQCMFSLTDEIIIESCDIKKYIILRNVDVTFPICLFFFCGKWCNFIQFLKSARKAMNNFFQIFMSAEQLFKSYSEARDFLLPTPKPQTTCENSAFQTKPSPIASSCLSLAKFPDIHTFHL